MVMVFITIIALAQNACKKDCDEVNIKNQYLKQLRVLEDNIDKIWSENGPSCNDVNTELQKLKDECGNKGVFKENDFNNIKSDIDNHCQG